MSDDLSVNQQGAGPGVRPEPGTPGGGSIPSTPTPTDDGNLLVPAPPASQGLLDKRTTKRTTTAILDSARRKLALKLEQIADAAGMPRAHWDDDRKKFYGDLNTPGKNAPAYLGLLKAALPRLVEPDPLQRGAGIQINIVTAQLSSADWEDRAKALKSSDDMARAGLMEIADAPRLDEPEVEPPIDVSFAEEHKPRGSED